MTSNGIQKNVKTVARHTVVYGLGIVARKGIGFFLIPLYTHYLAPAEYGISHLVALTSAFLVFFISLNMSYSLLKFFAEHHGTAKENLLVSTALISVTVMGILALAVVLPLSRLLSLLITGRTDSYHLFVLMACYNVFEVIATCCLTYIRALRKSLVFVLISLAEFIATISLNIYFIAGKGYGITGVWLSFVISQGCIALPLAFWVLSRKGIGFSPPLFRQMLRYGMPMLPGNITEFLMHYIDRPMLRFLGSLGLVGTYSLGHKFGALVNVFIGGPFEQIWSAHLFRVARESDARRIYARIATAYLKVLAACALAVAMLAPLALRLVADPKYYAASSAIPVLAVAYTFLAVSRIFRTGLLLRQRTDAVSWITLSAIGIEIVLDVILIPPYGIMGAATALLVGFLHLMVATCIVAHWEYVIPFEYCQMFCVALGAIGCFALSSLLQSDRMINDIALKLLILLAFSGILAVSERTVLRDLIAPREPVL